jgi:hypothetical protein
MTEPRLQPWSNGWLGIEDPANEIRNCGACGEDYQPGKACSCPSWGEPWNPR